MSFLTICRRTFGLLGAERRTMGLLVVGAVVLVVTQFAEPVLLGRLVNALTAGVAAGGRPSLGDLMPLIGAWIGFSIASIVSAVVVSLIADRFAHRRRIATMALFFEHALTLPMSFHASTHSGRSLTIMVESANAAFMILLGLFRENLPALMSIVVVLPVSLWLDWRLGLLLVALILTFGVAATCAQWRTDHLQSRVEEHHSTMVSRASDALGNVPVIQSFTRAAHETGAMREFGGTVLAAQMPVLKWWTAVVVFGRAASTITLLLIFVTGTTLYLHGFGSIGDIVMFMSFASLLIAKLEQLANFANTVFLQLPKLRDLFATLDVVSQVVERPGARDPGRVTGRVAFEDVSFAYPGAEGRSAVAGLSFVAEPGETIALVGATGSGKSTTLGLLHRTFDPTGGRITIDGVDIRDLTLDALRRNIGVVFQEPMLFDRSIEENIRVGRPDASAADIALALERAQADGVTRTRGLDSQIGERGRALSGGERQRVAIARALIKDPPIMILDEATAALDAETERKLQVALKSATAGRTTFVIAHRLATVRHADRILVLEGGRIIESGSFDELVARDGAFATLAAAQFMTRVPKAA